MQDLKPSEISAQLRVTRGVLMSDIKYMRINGDIGLIQAEKRARAQTHEKKVSLISKNMDYLKQNEKFLRMTGITLQEQSFRNMIDFNKHELLKILKSKDQHAAIVKLPTSIQKTLKKNGIIIKRWQDNEISERAQEYLSIKNPMSEF
jgi:hypothetical protein